MNNKEYLVQILLKLRGMGVKNEKILKAIEKMPPHFYYSFFRSDDDKKINIDEVLEIAKLLELSLQINSKNENVLLFGFKNGWLITLLTNFCKRVYGISNSMIHKKRLESFFLKNNYNNIYLCHGDDILSWRKVAPFDLIFIFNLSILSTNDITKQLSDHGMAFLFSKGKIKNVNLISIDKQNFKLSQDYQFKLLNRSELI